MNILIAAESFKGSCSAREVTDTIESAAKAVIPDVAVTKIPVADGGEGTVDALVAAMNGTKVRVPAHDPLGRAITAEYGLLPDGSAVIETAAASGLTLLKPKERDALRASTFGTGELIRHALEHGVKKIILGLGGSATTDGGAGLAQALGIEIAQVPTLFAMAYVMRNHEGVICPILNARRNQVYSAAYRFLENGEEEIFPEGAY